MSTHVDHVARLAELVFRSPLRVRFDIYEEEVDGKKWQIAEAYIAHAHGNAPPSRIERRYGRAAWTGGRRTASHEVDDGRERAWDELAGALHAELVARGVTPPPGPPRVKF